MKSHTLLSLLLFMGLAQTAFADQRLSYVDGSEPFLLINDANRQGEAWGICAAAYEIMSALMESGSAQAQQYKNLSNGASLAVVMTHVSKGLSSDMSQDSFNALWNYSKTLADSVPEVQKTMILADAESLGESGKGQFIERLGATVKVCVNNLDGQQTYVDTWRELAKSGLIQVPNE